MMNAKQSVIRVVPKEFAGQWIVWNPDRTVIVASGRTLPDAAKAARESGEQEPGFEWVPPANRPIIGAGR